MAGLREHSLTPPPFCPPAQKSPFFAPLRARSDCLRALACRLYGKYMCTLLLSWKHLENRSGFLLFFFLLQILSSIPASSETSYRPNKLSKYLEFNSIRSNNYKPFPGFLSMDESFPLRLGLRLCYSKEQYSPPECDIRVSLELSDTTGAAWDSLWPSEERMQMANTDYSNSYGGHCLLQNALVFSEFST